MGLKGLLVLDSPLAVSLYCVLEDCSGSVSRALDLGLKGLLVLDSPLAVSLYCVLEQDTLYPLHSTGQEMTEKLLAGIKSKSSAYAL